MHTNISRGLRIVAIVLCLGANAMAISTKQSFADVQLEREGPPSYRVILLITNRISRNDADYVAQHEIDFRNKSLSVYLGSPGGDVDAALKIGRIIRENEGSVSVPVPEKCFSSCALIYRRC